MASMADVAVATVGMQQMQTLTAPQTRTKGNGVRPRVRVHRRVRTLTSPALRVRAGSNNSADKNDRPSSSSFKENGGSRKAWAGAIGGAAGSFNALPAMADGLRMVPLEANGGGSKKKAAAEDGVKRVLIMMSDTGGGHRASAEAIRDAFQERFGGKFKIFIVDMWKNHCKFPVNRFGDSYSFSVKNPWLWRFQFRLSEPKFVHRPMMGATFHYVKRTLSKAFDEYKPHLVVSVHPLLQHVPLNVIKMRVNAKLMDPTPFATVVTDLTKCHPTWYHKDATACFVPTEVCREQAKSLGLKDSQIVMHGLPIRPQFSQKLPSKDKLRKKLGMQTDVNTVMMAGGGEGMGNLESTLEALRKTLPSNSQVVVICGRNEKLANRLKAKQYPFHIIVNGFVSNMSEWMAASDCLITKAGPGTIAEALIRGVPLLLNGCVPCQEEGNIPYVLDNNVGAFCKDPDGIAGIIADWFGPNRAELTAMAQRCKALGRPNATARIVEDLAALAEREFHKVNFVSTQRTPALA